MCSMPRNMASGTTSSSLEALQQLLGLSDAELKKVALRLLSVPLDT